MKTKCLSLGSIMHRRTRAFGSLSRLAACLVSAANVGLALADSDAPLLIEREASTLRLRDSVNLTDSAVLLRDVLDFSAADPRLVQEVGDKALFDAPPTTAGVDVSHDDVRQRLDALGVNMARVLLNGAYHCHIQINKILEPESPAKPAANSSRSPLMRDAADEHGSQTLADYLTQYIQAEFGADGSSVEVDFERGRQELLELTSPPFEFVVRSAQRQQLGLREFRVTFYRNGRREQTDSVFARVRLVKKVLVAAGPLNVGSIIRGDSVEYATRIFDDADETGFEHTEELLGQRVKTFVPDGQMVRRADIEEIDMVVRSRPVTVVGDGAVSVRLTGRALDSGRFGDSVRVQLGDTRANRRIIRGVVSGVAQVRLTEDE